MELTKEFFENNGWFVADSENVCATKNYRNDEAGYMLTYIEKVENGDTEFTIEIYSEDACGVLFATDGISYDSEKLKAALLFCGLDELANEIKS